MAGAWREWCEGEGTTQTQRCSKMHSTLNTAECQDNVVHLSVEREKRANGYRISERTGEQFSWRSPSFSRDKKFLQLSIHAHRLLIAIETINAEAGGRNTALNIGYGKLVSDFCIRKRSIEPAIDECEKAGVLVVYRNVGFKACHHYHLPHMPWRDAEGVWHDPIRITGAEAPPATLGNRSRQTPAKPDEGPVPFEQHPVHTGDTESGSPGGYTT